ncbi:MAG TPA: branched-chain amino acid ABC transporter permease, partial [Thermodesulfobacteriota bacterium]|nr:branched-chain amino acid ABC transporter permease [Thermodesulfobacteriota bacterium]
MDMEMLLRAVVFGISTSGILFLVSLGISIGFGLMRIVNMEQMVYYTFGAYVTYTVLTFTGSFWLGLLCGVILAAFLGYLVERL